MSITTKTDRIEGEVAPPALDRIIARIGGNRNLVIPLLQAVQAEYNYLPQPILRELCEKTEITPSDIAGVSTFYSQFRHTPAGQHNIKVCTGTACHVKGAPRVLDAVRRFLKIDDDDDTDSDKLFTVSEVPCIGCCTLAPAVQIDDITYGHLTPSTIKPMIDNFIVHQNLKARKKKTAANKPSGPLTEVRIGLGSCCIAAGSGKVFQAVEDTIADENLPGQVKVVGCVGMCHHTPLLEIVDPDGGSKLYSKVGDVQAKEIIKRHMRPRGLLGRIARSFNDGIENLLTDQNWDTITRHSIDVRDSQVCAFLGRQKHIASEYCGSISPLDIEEYRRSGGFEGLRKALEELSPQQVVDTVLESGLRGRGGAGFSTGTKWWIVAHSKSEIRYIVMNGDEGDPGAFMDRKLLESYPFRVLEGVIIAAYAVGAHEGILYIRAEYPLAIERMRAAIEICEKENIIGDGILGSNFSLSVRIMEGAGAFVCGEETALLASVEGRRGMPVLRPPYPAVRGYQGSPTLINNVETYSCVPWILRNGAKDFAALGTDKSKGTKVFSLAGKVRRGGLIEVPMGVTIREIVEDIGGGVADGRSFKAVQIGGPSGGCISADMSDTPIDFEALTSAGAMMGSGGLVVLDNEDCMVDIARYFLQFTQEQSCGKCTFCRVGTKQMLELLDLICSGKGKEKHIDALEELAHSIKAGSLCGLGKTAPNPILSTIRYFRDEYLAHINGECPAGSCNELIRYYVDENCIGCTICAQKCPVDAIAMRPYERHEIDDEKCIRCDGCREACPESAIKIGRRNDV